MKTFVSVLGLAAWLLLASTSLANDEAFRYNHTGRAHDNVIIQRVPRTPMQEHIFQHFGTYPWNTGPDLGGGVRTKDYFFVVPQTPRYYGHGYDNYRSPYFDSYRYNIQPYRYGQPYGYGQRNYYPYTDRYRDSGLTLYFNGRDINGRLSFGHDYSGARFRDNRCYCRFFGTQPLSSCRPDRCGRH